MFQTLYLSETLSWKWKGLVKFERLCYNESSISVTVFTSIVCEKGDDFKLKLSAEFFWRVFESTGSITAYLIYREIIRTML